jgi:hypothetical protein
VHPLDVQEFIFSKQAEGKTLSRLQNDEGGRAGEEQGIPGMGSEMESPWPCCKSYM